jgi:hypothetical protein
VSTAESVQLVGQKFLAGQGLDDDVQTGQNGVSLGQEVAIAQQFVLGNSGELAKFLLVFGVGSDETEFTRTHSIFLIHSEIIIAGKLPEKNLGRNIAVLFGLVPGLADDTAFVRAQDSFISIVSRDGGDGGGYSSGGGSGLFRK